MTEIARASTGDTVYMNLSGTPRSLTLSILALSGNATVAYGTAGRADHKRVSVPEGRRMAFGFVVGTDGIIRVEEGSVDFSISA